MTPGEEVRTEMVRRALGNPLRAGELGVLLARAGVGKTACLTHIALEHILEGSPVLHVCIGEIPDKIKVWYDELLTNLARPSAADRSLAELRQRVEASRFIMAFVHHTFSPAKLDENMRNLRDQVQFQPTLVILDGLDFEGVSRSDLQALGTLAQKYGAACWMSCRIHRHKDISNERGIPYPCHQFDDLFHAILMLEPQPAAIRIVTLKRYEDYAPKQPEVALNPQTFLLRES